MMQQSTKALIFLVATASCILEARSFLPQHQQKHLAFVSTAASSRRRVATLLNEKEWKDEDHLIHGASEIHEDTPEELGEEEYLAAWDAHDCNDAGMEAASEERALMMAQEMAHKLHEDAIRDNQKKSNKKSKTSESKNADNPLIIHEAEDIHEDTAKELRDEEDMAAWDAHDCNDAGMEAAAEERALMLAQEIAHTMQEEALKKKEKQQKEQDEKEKKA